MQRIQFPAFLLNGLEGIHGRIGFRLNPVILPHLYEFVFGHLFFAVSLEGKIVLLGFLVCVHTGQRLRHRGKE